MKKVLFGLMVFAFAFVAFAPMAHADTLGVPVDPGVDTQFKRGYYPEEESIYTVEYVNKLFNAIKAENPSCFNWKGKIAGVDYDFTH